MAYDNRTNYKQSARKPYRKKRVKRRQQWQNAGSKVGSMAYSAFKTANRIAKLINVETKYHDVSATGTTIDFNGTAVILNSPPNGTYDSQCIGDSIKCQRLILNGKVLANTSSADVRIMIIEDKANDLALTEIVTQVGNSLAPFGQKLWDNRFKFRVLYDELFDCVVSSDSEKQCFQIKLDLGHHTQFTGASTTIVNGAYKLIMYSNRVTTNLPTIDYVSRLEYTDD